MLNAFASLKCSKKNASIMYKSLLIVLALIGITDLVHSPVRKNPAVNGYCNENCDNWGQRTVHPCTLQNM